MIYNIIQLGFCWQIKIPNSNHNLQTIIKCHPELVSGSIKIRLVLKLNKGGSKSMPALDSKIKIPNHQTMSKIVIHQIFAATPSQVFESCLDSEDNKRWNTAGFGWSTGEVQIDPKVGGRWFAEYKSPDGKDDFVFEGVFTEIIENQKISYKMPKDMGEFEVDERKAEVLFEEFEKGKTQVTITFDAEDLNSIEMQKQGWQAILDNFKTFLERKINPENARLILDIDINASPQKVWKTLLEKESYNIWAATFSPGSHYQGEIKYDNKVQFLGPDQSGLISLVKVCIPEFQVSFEHLGGFKDGKEDPDSPMFLPWKGNRETYTLKSKNEITNLSIYQEMSKTEIEYFEEMWAKALEVIKKIAEES
jgi:uncharacterized protein YndB with AHSA1/START domain